MNHVGIDVSQKELVVAVSNQGKTCSTKNFENTTTGHREIIKLFAKLKDKTRICMEATGVYYFDLAVALSRSDNLEVMVINPKAAHNFAQALMKRSKTDTIDAATLAVYCERMPFEAWQRPADEVISLRAMGRRVAALNKLKTQTKNQCHALKATQDTPAIVIEQTEALVSVLEIQIQALRDSALELIRQHETLIRVFTLITSIKGIAEASAIQLLAELLVLPQDMNAKQWVAYAGLEPRHFESGTSIAKKPRISKAGNKYLRHALYMPALVAMRYEPNIQAYYQHLIENNGLKKLQALCAVMRKLLHAIHGMWKTNKEFDGSRFYTIPNDTSS